MALTVNVASACSWIIALTPDQRGHQAVWDQHLPVPWVWFGWRRRLSEAGPAAQGAALQFWCWKRVSSSTSSLTAHCLCSSLQDSIPFAIIGSNVQVESKGRKFRGRVYPWGVVEGTHDIICRFDSSWLLTVVHSVSLTLCLIAT